MYKIYDDQDFGNICFGVEKDGRKYFIKFAGAPTVEYTGNSADAVIKAVSDIRNDRYQTIEEFAKEWRALK